MWADNGRNFVLVLLAESLTACGDKPAATVTAPPPAHVENARPETALATVTLTPEAESRLGIQTVQVERQAVRESRRLAGEIIVPPGRTMTVSAPFAGVVLPPPGRDLLSVGARVEQGDAVMRIQPLPADGEALKLRADAVYAERQFELARQSAESARLRLRDRAITQAQADAAESALVRATSARDAARNYWGFLENGNARSADAFTAIAMAAPRAGSLQTMRVTAGQSVIAGQALYEVLGQNELWVKVPVYTGEVRTIDRNSSAHVVPLGQWDAATGVPVEPFTGPVSGDSGAASVDLFYRLDNSRLQFRPAERVTVMLPILRQAQSLVVPASAIWRDIYGGTWVYEKTAERTYSRRRITLTRVADELAMLASGPQQGTRVVSTGVAELAGTEFSVGH